MHVWQKTVSLLTAGDLDVFYSVSEHEEVKKANTALKRPASARPLRQTEVAPGDQEDFIVYLFICMM